jgi:hypothetical protein
LRHGQDVAPSLRRIDHAALERQGDPAPDICKRLSQLIDQNIIMIGRRCNAQPRRLQSPQAIVLHLLVRMVPALTPGTPLARLCPKVSVPAANESSGSGRWQGSDCTGTNPGRGRFPPKAGPGSTSGGLRHMFFRREYLTQRAPGSADLTPLRGESRSHATRETRAGSHPRS